MRIPSVKPLRRVFVALLLMASVALPLNLFAGSAYASADRLEFDVLRNGQPFGRHIVVLNQVGDTLEVASSVRLEAKVGPIVAYRYRSACQETWKASALESMVCSTTKGGKTKQVAVNRVGGALGVSVDGGATKTAPDVVPIAPWNMLAMTERQALTPDDGKIVPLSVVDLGKETILVGSTPIEARRIRYKSNLVVDSWYDSQGRWLKATFVARGQNIEYRVRL